MPASARCASALFRKCAWPASLLVASLVCQGCLQDAPILPPPPPSTPLDPSASTPPPPPASTPWDPSASTPGFQFLGFGYDVLQGNILETEGWGDLGYRTNVFRFTSDEGLKTPDGKWGVPDKTTSQSVSACSTEQAMTIFNSAYSYHRKVSTGIDISGSTSGVEFGFSIASKHIRSVTQNQKSIFAHVESTCSVYRLTMHTFDPPEFDPNFVAGANFLPLYYDEDAYMRFIKEFGTHVVTQMTVGGRWGWQVELRSKDYGALMNDSINLGFYLKVAAKAKVGLGHNQSSSFVTRVTDVISKNSSFSTGGNFKTDLKEWQESVRSQPMPVHISLLQLTDLFTETYLPTVESLALKRAHLAEALNNYCPYLRNSTDKSVNCTPPEPIPLPTPSPPLQNAIRGICVRNSGGFALKFDMYVPSSPKAAGSEVYPVGQDRCLDGMMIDAERRDTLRCRVSIIAGIGTSCAGDGHPFDPRATARANYECHGTTLSPNCVFKGISNIGA